MVSIRKSVWLGQVNHHIVFACMIGATRCSSCRNAMLQWEGYVPVVVTLRDQIAARVVAIHYR